MTKNKRKYIEKMIQELKSINNIQWSNDLCDRMAGSTDISGSSYYHHQWKKKYIADLIIWPINEEQIKKTVHLAKRHRLSITARGGGCNYFGSSYPFNGGIILDMKKMNHFDLNREMQTLTVEAGATFGEVLEYLKRSEFQLPCFPTSAKSATFGGWLSTGGKIGEGTAAFGDLLSNIVELSVITPNNELITYSTKQEIALFQGSLGIFGIIVRMILKVHPKAEILLHYARFDNIPNLVSFLKEIEEINILYYCFFANFDLNVAAAKLKVNNKDSNYIDIIIATTSKTSEFNRLLIKYCIKVFSAEITQFVWNERFNFELYPKIGATTLISQHYHLSLKNLQQTLEYYIKLLLQLHIFGNYSGIFSSFENIRLSLSIPSTKDAFEHLLPSKAILHQITKKIYYNSGKIYTIGLLNSIYRNKFEKNEKLHMKKQKSKVDPQNFLNPGKLTSGTATYLRINILFQLNYIWRKRFHYHKNTSQNHQKKEVLKIFSPGILDLCSKCGYCRNICPSFVVDPKEINSPLGRLGVLKTILEEKLTKLLPQYAETLFHCTTCQACESVCPVNVPVVNIIEMIRLSINSPNSKVL